jgi:hypothetical protein
VSPEGSRYAHVPLPEQGESVRRGEVESGKKKKIGKETKEKTRSAERRDLFSDLPFALGHFSEGAEHTLLVHSPYRQSLPRLQPEPTTPTSSVLEEMLRHLTLESPMTPRSNKIER